MIIFKDIVSDDELISDAFNLKEVDGVAYEADCREIQINGEGVEEHVIDIVHYFRLGPIPFADKKEYLGHLKGYLKAVEKNLKIQGKSDEELRDHENKTHAFANKVMANFNNYDFYVGESLNTDGMVVLLNYRDDGVTPYVTFWKHGLKGITQEDQ